MKRNTPIRGRHFIVVWRDRDTLEASHEGTFAASPEHAAELATSLIEDSAEIMGVFGEGQLLRMLDFIRAQSRKPPPTDRAYVVFYTSDIVPGSMLPADRTGEGWIVMGAQGYQDALHEAAAISCSSIHQFYLAYDTDDIEMITGALIDSRLLGDSD